MIYYKTDIGNLIQFNPISKVYKQRNIITKIDPRISIDDFLKLKVIKINKNEFCRLMNIFFKNIKHSWIHEYEHYCKLDNFESKDYQFSSNYVLGKDIPFHNLNNDNSYHNRLILVYHWGRVYYHTISYGGDDRGELIDIYSKKFVQWASLKHCAPIFNERTKKIC